MWDVVGADRQGQLGWKVGSQLKRLSNQTVCLTDPRLVDIFVCSAVFPSLTKCMYSS